MASRDPLTRALLDVALLRKALRDIADYDDHKDTHPRGKGITFQPFEQYARKRALDAEAGYLEDQEKRKAKDLTPLSHKEQMRKYWENINEPST